MVVQEKREAAASERAISLDQRFMMHGALAADGVMICRRCGNRSNVACWTAIKQGWQIGAYHDVDSVGAKRGGTYFAPTCPVCIATHTRKVVAEGIDRYKRTRRA